MGVILSGWGKYEIIRLCIKLGEFLVETSFDLGREIVFWYNTRAVRKMYFFKILSNKLKNLKIIKLKITKIKNL